MNRNFCPCKCFIELYFLSSLFVKVSFLSLCRLFSVVHEHSMQYSKMPRVSCGAKDYGVLEVKCKREWFQNLFLLGEINTSFILKHNSITAYCSFKHLTARIASSALCKIQKWLSGRVILEIGENKIFRKFLLKAHYYPAYYIMADWLDWTVPPKSEFSIWKCFMLLSFYNLLSKGSAGLDRPEYWISVICLVRLFCEKLQNYN